MLESSSDKTADQAAVQISNTAAEKASGSPKRNKKSKKEQQEAQPASETTDQAMSKRDSSSKKQPDQRQNRGRRQPSSRQEDSKQQQKVYKVKGAQEDADQETEVTTRPKTQRNRRAAAEDLDDDNVGEVKKNTRAKSTRRRRDKSLAAVVDGEEESKDANAAPKKRNQRNKKGGDKKDSGDAQTEKKPQGKELSKQEKERLALEKKREKMSNQYEPFVSKRQWKSRFSEYQFAEWRRKRSNLFVTVETIVPKMPEKLLKEPDDAQYHLNIAKLDEQLEKIKEEFKELVAEQHATRTLMKTGQVGKNPIREKLNELFGELNIINAEKKEKLGQMEVLNKKMQDVNRELDKHRKAVHPVYNSLEKLEKGVKELEQTLMTHSWKRAEEKGLMNEIEQVKSSRKIFVKIEEERAKLAELKQQREAIKTSLTPVSQIVNALKEKIGQVKSQESVYDKEKQLKQYDLTNVGTKIEKNFEQQRAIKQSKYELKETFYGLMCDYEIQQVLIKDIEWMTKTQQMAAERAERTAKYKLEQRARNEERKKRAEQQAQYKAEIKAQQEERRLAQQAKQREWELAQLEKLDEDPYESQIDLCEQLIYFCAKNKKRTEEQDDGPAQEESKEPTAEREEKKVDPKSGKIEVAQSKAERDTNNTLNSLQQQKKKRQRNRDGPSTFYYEDEDRIDLDYQTLQKFGSIDISPPTEIDQVEAANKKLVALRDALKLKGSIDIAENKAKFSKDNSGIESEEHLQAKAKYAELDASTKSAVDKIISKQRFSRQNDDDDEGDFRPQRGNRRGNDTNERNQRQGRGDGQQNRRQRRDNEDEEGDEKPAQKKGGKKQENKPREKIAGNVDAFPELGGDVRKD